MEYITKSTQETKRLGQKLAPSLRGVIALSGELGSGKTTFVQGFAQGLGVKNQIISPTFIILRKYGDNFYHVDLYRLEGEVPKEVENLGLSDIWNEPNNTVVIEWAEKIKSSLPPDTTWINFEVLGESERKVTII